MCVYQVYGKKQIVLERDEVDAMKKFEDPGMYLIGFKPLKMLKIHHHIHPAVFIYPEEDMVKGRVACTSCRLLLITTAVESAEPCFIASHRQMCLPLMLNIPFCPFFVVFCFIFCLRQFVSLLCLVDKMQREERVRVVSLCHSQKLSASIRCSRATERSAG